MKSEIFLSVVLVASAAGGGYWLGQRHAPTSATAANQISANTAAPKTAGSLPPLPVISVVTVTNAASSSGAKLSLADIEAKILELKKKGPLGFGYDGEQDMMKLLLAVEPADIPAVLAFADKNLPKQMRWSFRYGLLQRWGEVDVAAAMAYANALTDRQEREGAIGIVGGQRPAGCGGVGEAASQRPVARSGVVVGADRDGEQGSAGGV